MPKREKSPENIYYYLPLFTRNLMTTCKITIDQMQSLYIELLYSDIEDSAENLRQELSTHVSEEKDAQYQTPKLSVLKKPKKRMINYLQQLQGDCASLEKLFPPNQPETERRYITKDLYRRVQKSIDESLVIFDHNLQEGAGGATEKRSISQFLNPTTPPLSQHEHELMFVLTRCIPRFFSSHRLTGEHFRQVALQSSDSMREVLFAISGNLCLPEDDVIRDIDTALSCMRKGGFGNPPGYVRLPPSYKKAFPNNRPEHPAWTQEEKSRFYEEAFSEMFSKVGTILSAGGYVEVGAENWPDEPNDEHYEMGQKYARTIFRGISSLPAEIVDQKWIEVSEHTFSVIELAYERSKDVYHKEMDEDMRERERLFVAEFLLLFFSDSKIRSAINELALLTSAKKEAESNE